MRMKPNQIEISCEPRDNEYGRNRDGMAINSKITLYNYLFHQFYMRYSLLVWPNAGTKIKNSNFITWDFFQSFVKCKDESNFWKFHRNTYKKMTFMRFLLVEKW